MLIKVKRLYILALLAVPALLLWLAFSVWALFLQQLPAREDFSLDGLLAPVVLRRDSLGVPRLEAQNMADLGLATGWVMAEDRLAQMITLNLVAQGRLAEMAGASALGLDVLMRTIDLAGTARKNLQRLSPEALDYLTRFSAGVNQYIVAQQGGFSASLQLAGWQPEPWKPLDSMHLMVLLSHALSYNLMEELAFLQAAAKVGPRKASWLLPVYPDAPLSLNEALKLEGLSLKSPPFETLPESLHEAAALLGQLGQVAASNSWVLRPELTRHGAVILANDSHLVLSQPSLWMMMNLALPDQAVAGVALAGVPLIVAGANHDVAWGITMLQGDTQDIFLERMIVEDGQWLYETPEGWLTSAARQEKFKIKGADDYITEIRTTRHGPLLNEALHHPSSDLLQPYPLRSEYGLALSSTLAEGDESFDAIWRLNHAADMDEAIEAAMAIEACPLNVLIADPQHIAWVVTGRFPLRKNSIGHFPSPGWSGEYDWQGFIDEDRRPMEIDPDNAFFANANNRVLEKTDQPFQLSSSWYSPERYERIMQLVQQIDEHDLPSSLAMQLDRLDLFFMKIKHRWGRTEVADSLRLTRSAMPDEDRLPAQKAMDMLLEWDGYVTEDSAHAALWGMFEHHLTRALFLDELGPDDSATWRGFLRVSAGSYPALQDHLLGRVGSPFWDNIETPEVETRYHTINQALATSYRALSDSYGEPSQWRWGQLHTYTWKSGFSRLAPELPWWQRAVVSRVGVFLDRGPFAAGGNRNTLNVAGFTTGADFAVWNVPAMRMLVDFSQEEPLHLVIAGGQSDDVRSPHYDDGITLWLRPETRQLPLYPEAVEKQYTQVQTISPAIE